mgnify:CR=1 FL=1
MGKSNYSFEKRQKQLAKKRKKDEKRQRKTGKQSEHLQEGPPQPSVDSKTDV